MKNPTGRAFAIFAVFFIVGFVGTELFIVLNNFKSRDLEVKQEKKVRYSECLEHTPDVEWCIKTIYGLEI